MDGDFAYRLILWCYDRLAALFPREFRARFTTEPRQVFEDRLRAARADGQLRSLLLHESLSFPGALVRCHWAALQAGGWKRLLEYLALSSLILTAGIGIFSLLPTWIGIGVGYTFLGVIAAGLLAAIVLGFPRWALPYPGFILAIVLLILTPDLYRLTRALFDLVLPSHSPMSDRLIYTAIFQGIHKLVLLAIVLLAVLLLRLLNRRQPKIWNHPRAWADLSFVFYGAAVFSAFISLDEYRHAELLGLAAAICLLGGAWGYLRSANSAAGLRCLVLAIVLSFITLAVGKWLVVPLQDWHDWFLSHPPEVERWFEGLATLIEMAWLCLLILTPAAWRWYTQNPPAPLNLPKRA